MVALHSGVGQVVDVNLLESLLQVMGPIVPAWFQTGFLQGRMGSSLPNSVPRGVWLAADGRWVAISASSDSVARRVMQLVGLGEHPGVATVDGRVEHRAEVEGAVARFVARRPAAEVVASFEAAEAAAAVVYQLSDLAVDPHVTARGSFVEVDGVTMQGLVARLSATPGAIRWAGRPYGADTDSVFEELDRPTP
jgi:crotonobetainyl-CoA:carnitine CoA-transferase CaiB-like acyl-CoA transferase